MFQKIWSGLTTAAFMVATVGTAAPGQTSPASVTDDEAQIKVSHPESQADASDAAAQGNAEPTSLTEAPLPSTITNPAATNPAALTATPNTEVSKIGEYQSEETAEVAETAIATLLSHPHQGRQATTIYVRSIPVITFLGSPLAQSRTQANAALAPSPTRSLVAVTAENSAGIKLATPPESSSDVSVTPKASAPADKLAQIATSDAWRAAAIAAQLNQLYRSDVDAETITVRWDAQQRQYVIRVGDSDLLTLGPDVVLPDSTGNRSVDALQMTNRLRRLLGSASPLQEIAGSPSRRSLQISLGSIQIRLSGLASWYGPGFHGNRSASGEIFNQHDLTAAHRTLPFGTRVRVTNLRTGQAVVVRINDRGPFSRGRVIDLSAAAARAVGLLGMGVAPVNLEVLSSTQTAYQP